MIDWLIWALLLVLQNASHTASSRAKNSRSLWYSSVTSIFSNGVWFASQIFVFNCFVRAKGDWRQLCLVAVYYVSLTTLGTVAAHAYLLTFERKRGL